jgi:hypothetical protein
MQILEIPGDSGAWMRAQASATKRNLSARSRGRFDIDHVRVTPFLVHGPLSILTVVQVCFLTNAKTNGLRESYVSR